MLLSFFSEHLETRIRSTNSSPRENLKVYGDDYVQFVDLLERAYKQGRLKKMPVGPIGNYIEVKNAKYRPFVENTLGMILMAFCVDNSDDLVEFRNIWKSVKSNRQPFVITAKFSNNVFNMAGKCVEPNERAVRLIDLIVVENPVAMNCLLDSSGVERIMFAESADNASYLTSKRENVPRNLFKLMLLEPYSEYFPAPSYRSYGKVLRPARYLRVSAAQREM